ncbi:hypothetical protein [uncultured Pedobacter sp.]|uniref:hypothetical protein n=1 Tax=uncultured Pedobacter sp. TaxID=246139 RepID=UPI0026010C99|nr:hypothetical protein [uncultured Pedobacter sp.]
MTKFILKYWMIDLLVGIVLYIAYVMAIMGSSASGNGFGATIRYIADLVLNIGFSLLYLVAAIICSFTIFLNFIREIRFSPFFSWLSFSGAPILLIGMFIASLSLDGYHYSGNVMTKLWIFVILYPCITTILYLQFRKQYRKLNKGIGKATIYTSNNKQV